MELSIYFGLWKNRKELSNFFKVWKEIKNKKMVKRIFKKSTYNPKKAIDSLDRVFKKIQDPNTHFNELQVRYFQKTNGRSPLVAHTVLIVYKDPKNIFCYDNEILIKFDSNTITNFLNEIKKGEIVDIHMNAITTNSYGYGYPEFHTIKAFPN